MKAKQKPRKRTAFARGVERGLQRAARSARTTARMHGTIVAVKP